MEALVVVRLWISLVDMLRAHATVLAMTLACGASVLLFVRFLVVRALARALDDEARARFIVSHPRVFGSHLTAALVNPLNVWMTLLARRALHAEDAPPPLVVDTRAHTDGARTALGAVLVAFRDQVRASPRAPRAVLVSLVVLALQQVAMQTSMLLVTAAFAGELAFAFVAVGAGVFAFEIALTLLVERTLTGTPHLGSALLRFVTQPLAMLALPLVLLAALLTSTTVKDGMRALTSVLTPEPARVRPRV